MRGNNELADELSVRVQIRDVAVSEAIIQQGADDNDVYFILAGSFEIVVNGRAIAVRSAKEHIGEMAAILPSLRRSATVRALDRGVVARLSAIELISLANKFPSMWQHFASVLAERLFQRNALVTATHGKIRIFVISSAEALPIAGTILDIRARPIRHKSMGRRSF